jgi:hypothetical protein
MRLVIGITKKIGQPGFGSVGATCQIESSEFAGAVAPSELRCRVERAFDACREAVDAELRRHQGPRQYSNVSNANPRNRTNEPSASPRHHPDGPSTNGNGRAATPKQLSAIRAMAARRRLTADQLEGVFHGKPIHALTITEASIAIDRLNGGPADQSANRRLQSNP